MLPGIFERHTRRSHRKASNDHGLCVQLCKSAGRKKESILKPVSIVIVGGGTAGWITASVLQRRLCQGGEQPVQITLVESERIGILGVGEATVPTIRTLLRFLGIDEDEFIIATSASFKHGIHYRDWVHEPGAANNTYFHPFDYSNILNFSPQLWWLAVRGDVPGAQYAEDTGSQFTIAGAGKAPRTPGMPPYDGPNGYAYHLDAERLAEFLAARAVRRGVTRLYGTVKRAVQADDGSIEAIVTDEHGMIEGDFFVDCTGFTGLLMNKALGVGFTSYNDALFCDRAVALRVPTAPDEAMRPYTTTTAKPAGWVWEIDLQSRRGTGYVYSSNHSTPEQAETEIRRHIGPRSDGLQARHLHMRVGRSDSFWHKNVAAVGLSGGFIEPLESTGIYLIETGALQLMDSLQGVIGLVRAKRDESVSNGSIPSAYLAALEPLAAIYNRRMTGLYEEIRDFVKVHYFLTRRRDTPFWRDNTEPSSAPDSLLAMLEQWSIRPPQQFDFTTRSSLFNEHSWLFIMLGMGWRPKTMEGFRSSANHEAGSRLMAEAAADAKRGLAMLPDHRSYFSMPRGRVLQAKAS